jgi:CheY-like chemotaxis protein
VNGGHLEQVLMNLAVNARDAMAGRGLLTVEVASAELGNAYACQHDIAPGRYAMLAVSDTGAGMDAETQRHIFEPFFTTKEPGSGTGLGLAVVYGVVKESGGHIDVTSEPGRGSTFKIYLPAVEKELTHGEDAGRGDGDGTPEGTETILLVEDDQLVRTMVVKVLTVAGYEVLSASGGGEAEAIVDRGDVPDLLVTDVIMPELNGREVADRLRQRLPGLRVLFMSGFTDDAILRSDLLEPDSDFLQKPFRSRALTAKVREVLDRQG